jgi:hypothetical protein
MSGGAAPPPAPNETLAFVIGLVVGLFVGGTALTLMDFLALALLAGVLHTAGQSTTWFLMLGTLPALALAWLAIVQSRKAMNFVSGGLIGAAAGLLGGATICALTFGALGSMK